MTGAALNLVPTRRDNTEETRIPRDMANTTVIHQPGISYQKEYSGSVQYIGGYEGPYVDDADVFVQQAPGSSNHVPIPMGLEVFENVSKFVAHQNVAKEDGK